MQAVGPCSRPRFLLSKSSAPPLGRPLSLEPGGPYAWQMTVCQGHCKRGGGGGRWVELAPDCETPSDGLGIPDSGSHT